MELKDKIAFRPKTEKSGERVLFARLIENKDGSLSTVLSIRVKEGDEWKSFSIKLSHEEALKLYNKLEKQLRSVL
jgi:hypothetical protein